MGSEIGGDGEGAGSSGGGDWGFLGVVGLTEEEGSEPEEAGKDSEVAQGSKPGDGTLGTQTSNESLLPGHFFFLWPERKHSLHRILFVHVSALCFIPSQF